MIFLSGATQVGTGVCMTTRAPVLLQSNSVEAFPGLIEPQKDRVMDVRWNTHWLFTSSTPAPLLPLWTFSFLPSWPLPVRSAFPGQHLTSTSLSLQPEPSCSSSTCTACHFFPILSHLPFISPAQQQQQGSPVPPPACISLVIACGHHPQTF